MNILNRKLYRDIWRQKSQFFAIILLVMLGVTLFGASYDSYQNLKNSYAQTHKEYNAADIWLRGVDFDEAALDKVLNDSDVIYAQRRLVTDQAAKTKEDLKVTARFIGLPDTGQPQINRLKVMEGNYLVEGEDSVLLEKHFAEYHGYSPGDTIALSGADGWHEFRIEGIVGSPEYIWPAKNRQEMLTSPDNFGVLYLGESRLDSLLQSGGVRNEIVVRTDKQDVENWLQIEARLTKLLGNDGLVSSYTRDTQASNEALKQDLEGFSELAIFFPFLFFGIAAISISVMMTRLVHQQRPQIGVLRASGFGKNTILFHYLKYGLIVAACGAVPGVIFGLFLSRIITLLYTSMLSIPVVSYGLYPMTIVSGFVMAFVACLLSCWAPARMAIRLHPALAMRGETPTGAGRVSLLEKIIPRLKRLAPINKIPLRGIERNRRRSMYTILGIIFAIILLLVSWGMLDTVNYVVDKMFNVIYEQDLIVSFDDLVGSDHLNEISQTDGITKIEPALAMPVTLKYDEQNYETVLMAFREDTAMHTFLDEHDKKMTLPTEGIFLGIGLRDEYGLEVGDKISFVLDADMMRQMILEAQATSLSALTEQQKALLDTLLQTMISRPFTSTVRGFVNETIGSAVYISLENLQSQIQAFGFDDKVNMAYLQVEPGQRLEIRKELSDLSSVVRVEDSRALEDTLREMMSLFYLFMGVMLAFGALMAFGLIFNTMTVNIMERTREIATLRTLGFTRLQITRMITTENLILVLIALLPGLVCGYYSCLFAMKQMNSDVFQFEVVVYPQTYVIVSMCIIIVALLSQVPALRSVHRMDLTKIIKERTS